MHAIIPPVPTIYVRTSNGWDDTYEEYSGTRYSLSRSTTTRLDTAKTAINGAAQKILAQDDTTVQLVTFANDASHSDATADLDAFKGQVNAMTANGGTNWEAGLNEALNQVPNDGKPTYVIFVSDGQPTYRNSQMDSPKPVYEEGWFGGAWVNAEGGDAETINSDGSVSLWGTGNSDPNGWNFNAADAVAKTLTDPTDATPAGKGVKLFSINAYGDATNMQNLTGVKGNDNHYFTAKDQASLENAFANIVNQITSSAEFQDVSVVDQVTNLTAVAKVDGKTAFEYYKGDQKVDSLGEATYTGGKINWDLSSLGKLEDGVTYTLSVKVWPSQGAMDAAASAANGGAAPSDPIVVDKNGNYALKSNADSGNTVTYRAIDTKTATQKPTNLGTDDKDPEGYKWEQKADGTWTGTKVSEPITKDLNNPDPMPLDIARVNLAKEWKNGDGSDATAPAGASVKLTAGEGDAAVSKALNAGNSWTAQAALSYGRMTVDEKGTVNVLEAGHVYAITEEGAPADWTFSADTYLPMIINGTPTMLKQVTGDETPTYTIGGKGYIAVSGDAAAKLTATNTRKLGSLTVSKTVNNETTTDVSGQEFTFTVKVDGKDDQTVTLKAGESQTIEGLPAGASYTVTEDTDSPPQGFSLDSKTGDTGKIVADQTATASFTNKYKPDSTTVDTDAETSPMVQKTVSAPATAIPEKGKTFNFTITPKDGAPAPKNGDETVTTGSAVFTKDDLASGSSTKAIDFGTITFTAEGTYTYTVAETGELGNGWTVTPEDKSVDVTITVKDENGQLKAEVTGDTITNSYKADPGTISDKTGDSIKVTKKLADRDWLDSDSFEFTLTAETEGAPMPDSAKVTATKANPTVTFGTMTFDKAGTYNYTVKETKGSIAGVTYDEGSYPVTVVVSDNGSGQLSAEVSYTKGNTVTNTYKPTDGTLPAGSIKLYKTLTNGVLKDDQFSFQLTPVTNGAPMPETDTATNDASGYITFGDITFSATGYYEYQVTELKPTGETPYTYSDSVVTVKVHVSDDTKNGTLVAEVVEGNGATFNNTYNAESNQVAITASKNVNGQPASSKDVFNFKLEAVTEGAPMPASDTVQNVGGSVTFGAITYTANIFSRDDVVTPEDGTARYVDFTYRVSEVAGSSSVYGYDSSTYDVTVRVTDDGNGTLTAAVKDAAAPVFNNTYTPNPVTVTDPPVSKKVTGFTGNKYPAFTFQMTSKTDGAPMPEGTVNGVKEATIAGEGAVEFGQMTFTKADTYVYAVSEKGLDADGWTTDSTLYTLTYTVTDNNGQLEYTLAVDNVTTGDKGLSEATFTNTYKALPAGGYLNAKKVLNGRDLKAGEFSFQLLDADGKEVLDTRTNEADGTVTFNNLSFDAADTYTYQVREVKGDDSTITYDEATHTYVFTVEDENGQLKVTSVKADGKDEAAVFTNTYTEPATPVTPTNPTTPNKPTPATPAAPASPAAPAKSSGAVAKTGDTTTSVAGIVIVAGGLYLRKRNASAKK